MKNDPSAELTPVQRRTLRLIADNPLINWNALRRLLSPDGENRGGLRHSLDALLRHGLIVEVLDGNMTRHYVNGAVPRDLVPVVVHLRHERRGALLRFLLEQGDAQRHRDARRALGIEDSALRTIVHTLMGARLVKRGRAQVHAEYTYSLVDAGRVRAAVAFLDRTREQAEVPA